MMIKRGICSISQLLEEIDRPADRRVRQVAINLLNELPSDEHKTRMRERIFLELADDRGAYKRTYRNRFDEFDRLLLKTIHKVGPSARPLTVLDCGISDGRTAVDFFASLSNAEAAVNYYGTDYDPYLQAVTVGGSIVVFSSYGTPVQLIRSPFVFNLKVPDRWISYPVNRLVLTLVGPGIMARAKEKLQNQEAVEDIALFCNEAIELSERDARFRLGRLDVLDPFPGQWHIIRMMNLLNPTYFSRDEFARIFGNVKDSLHESGLFVIGSNQDAGSAVTGGIYQASGGRLVECLNQAMNPELRELILARR